MAQVETVGKFLVIVGLVLVGLGLLLMWGPSLPFQIGRLPGDIYIKKDNFTFYFPLTTSILISILLTIIFYFLRK